MDKSSYLDDLLPFTQSPAQDIPKNKPNSRKNPQISSTNTHSDEYLQQTPVLLQSIEQVTGMSLKYRNKMAIRLKYLQLLLIESEEGYFNLLDFRKAFRADWKRGNNEASKRYLSRLIKLGHVKRYRLNMKRKKAYAYNFTTSLKYRLNRL
jgi:hypothetical protein